MGWAHCGKDSKGRDIGYAIDAICDQEGCREEIHRGLSFVCGGMHGGDGFGCGGYFCMKHLHIAESPDGRNVNVCSECLSSIEKEGK